jgi:hypothetical protein
MLKLHLDVVSPLERTLAELDAAVGKIPAGGRPAESYAATCWTAGNWINAASVTGVPSARVTGWPAQ